MKARKKGTNDEFVPFGVALNGNWTIYDQSDIEFEQDQTLTSNDEHWQSFRKRVAIAAIQGITSNSYIVRDIGSNKVVESIATTAICLADALVEQLKKEQK